jgi:anthranilate phosphoribosyltransferase
MRPITLEELGGFRTALQKLCLAVDLSEFSPIDLCGTGGDGKDTFNISTLASFVTAGAGIKVAKHGNYGVSSGCGSSNVLEHLGIKFSNNSDFLKRCIDQAGICNLHAPLFHPAMKNVAPIRRELGVKTFFNMLGPLVNPAFPKHQLTGVFNLELARIYGYLFQQSDQNFTILYALDGYDEISLTCPAKAIGNGGEQLIYPEDFGLEPLGKDQINGGDSIPSSASIFMAVLEGKGTAAQSHVVCANAAMAIATATGCSPLQGFEKAQESLQSGRAVQAFKTLQKLSTT